MLNRYIERIRYAFAPSVSALLTDLEAKVGQLRAAQTAAELRVQRYDAAAVRLSMKAQEADSEAALAQDTADRLERLI